MIQEILTYSETYNNTLTDQPTYTILVQNGQKFETLCYGINILPETTYERCMLRPEEIKFSNRYKTVGGPNRYKTVGGLTSYWDLEKAKKTARRVYSVYGADNVRIVRTYVPKGAKVIWGTDMLCSDRLAFRSLVAV